MMQQSGYQQRKMGQAHLVLRSAPYLATTALTTEIGIIHLDVPFKDIAFFTFGHRQHGLTDQIDRQKPNRQGQLGTLKYRSSNQRRLMAAGNALKHLAGSIPQDVMRLVTASWAAKTIRPANCFQRLLALHLGIVTFQQLGHRQPLLKLNSIRRHDVSLRIPV